MTWLVDVARRALRAQADQIVREARSMERPRPFLAPALDAARAEVAERVRAELASEVAAAKRGDPDGPLWWCFGCSSFATGERRCGRCGGVAP